MSSDSLPLDPRALIEHREFVRMLAKSLLADEHAAQDVAQDTLLTLITHPPRSFESVRGWLAQVTRNRVHNVRREKDRRTGREALVARREADDAIPASHERLELQHRVVESVLALREPYKTVIVLTYYDGLSTAEIAGRQNVPAGTVRAQLSRAHEMLRQKLDAEFGGKRNVWSAALTAWTTRSSAGASGAKLAATTLIAASIVVVAAGVWIWSGHGSTLDGPVIADAPTISNANSDPNPGPQSLESSPTQSPESEHSSRAPVEASVLAAVSAPSELDALVTESRQIQLLLRERLLTPDAALVAARRDLAALPDVHYTRLWQRGALGADFNNQVGLRGAGAYFSFATGLQDYDSEPDLSLDLAFQSEFYGGSAGAVARLDGVRLADLRLGGSPCPSSVASDTWSTLWEESKMDEKEIPSQFYSRVRKIADDAWQRQTNVPVLGGTYLVRHASTGEHDLVAAFEVIERDEKSCTIAWRVLERWPIVSKRKFDKKDPLADVPPPPAKMRSLSTDALVARREELSALGAKLILDPPRDLSPALAKYASQRDGGLARIAERSRWDSLLSIDGGGAYWSFTQRSNDYQKEAQIELQQGRFTSGFAGHDRGYVLDLGETPLDRVDVGLRLPALDERGQMAAEFLRDLAPAPLSADRNDLEISGDDHARASKLGLLSGARSMVGHSYLVRSVQTNQQDVLAAFQVLARDEGGLTIAWKILRQQPASR